MFDEYLQRGVIDTLDEKDKEFTEQEHWRFYHYFNAGADALRIIVSSLHDAKREPPKTILDFPSGSGRVARHLKSFFPEAKIVACDLYDYHVDFCINELGVEGKISSEFIDQIKLK